MSDVRELPGSGRLVGGPLSCMVHELQTPLVLADWTCPSLYMHLQHTRHPKYDESVLTAVRDALDRLRASPDAAAVLVDGHHAPGHPLPGFFTVTCPGYRIDFWACDGGTQCEKSLVALIYRTAHRPPMWHWASGKSSLRA